VRDRSYAGLVPKLSLEYSDTYSYNAGGSAKGNQVDGSYPTQSDQRLLLVGKWSLNGGNEITTALSGTEKIHEARYRAQDVRMRIEQAVKSSYNAINAANQRIAVLQKGVAADSRVVVEFEDQYKNGRRSLFELLDAHEQLYGARLNLMRIAIARAQASYLVRRQMGDLVPTLITAGRS
jgi:adhesin transport system outer membrane protein